MMDAMKKALDAKKAKGLVIEISVKPEEGEAPMAEVEAPVAEVEAPVDDNGVKDHLLSEISESDKEDMMNRKPRSLMERVKQKALKE